MPERKKPVGGSQTAFDSPVETVHLDCHALLRAVARCALIACALVALATSPGEEMYAQSATGLAAVVALLGAALGEVGAIETLGGGLLPVSSGAFSGAETVRPLSLSQLSS